MAGTAPAAGGGARTDSGGLPAGGRFQRLLRPPLHPAHGGGHLVIDAGGHAGLPLGFFLRFFANHGLLEVASRPQWYVIPGGSRNISAPYGGLAAADPPRLPGAGDRRGRTGSCSRAVMARIASTR